MFDHPSFDQHERVVFAPEGVIGVGRGCPGGDVGRGCPGGATAESILAEIRRIPVRDTEFFARLSVTNCPTSELADPMARQFFVEAR